METSSDDAIPSFSVPLPGDQTPSWYERRELDRYAPIEDRVWIGWWDGRSFHRTAAQLLDISRRGAAVACDEVLEAGSEAWFCIVGSRLSGGARVRVVGRVPLDDRGRSRVRFRFQPHCPEDIFRVALSMAPADYVETELN